MGCLRKMGNLGKMGKLGGVFAYLSGSCVFRHSQLKGDFMKNVHVYDIKTEDGQSLVDLIIPVDIGYEWMDVFEKVQGAYLDNVDSYSYTEV